MNDARVDTSDVYPSNNPFLCMEQDDQEDFTIFLDKAFYDTECIILGRCDVLRIECDIRCSDLLADTSDLNEYRQFYGKAPFTSEMQ